MIFGISLLLAAAVAQQAPSKAASAKPEGSDPVICERYKEVGSLLRTKKVCKTKREWAEQRRSDQAEIQRSQLQVGIKR